MNFNFSSFCALIITALAGYILYGALTDPNLFSWSTVAGCVIWIIMCVVAVVIPFVAPAAPEEQDD